MCIVAVPNFQYILCQVSSFVTTASDIFISSFCCMSVIVLVLLIFGSGSVLIPAKIEFVFSFLSFHIFLYMLFVILCIRSHIAGLLLFLTSSFDSTYISSFIILVIDMMIFFSCSFVSVFRNF